MMGHSGAFLCLKMCNLARNIDIKTDKKLKTSDFTWIRKLVFTQFKTKQHRFSRFRILSNLINLNFIYIQLQLIYLIHFS